MAFPTLGEILVAVKALIKSYNENSAEIVTDNVNFDDDEFMGYTKAGIMYKIKSAVLKDKLFSGSPAGTYDTVADLETDNPDHKYVYLVTADGNWYYWDIALSSWESGGIYQDSAAFNDLAGSGRTDETVKGNTDTIATKESIANVDTLKGTGWSNETVKGNADDIENNTVIANSLLQRQLQAQFDFPLLHPSRIPQLVSLDASKIMYFRCSAGWFNFSWDNPSGRLWAFPEGTVLHSDGTTPIKTSTDEQVDVDVPDGVVILYSDSWDGDYTLIDNGTNAHFVGDLIDIPDLTSQLDLFQCSQMAGDISNIPINLTYCKLGYCLLLTGDLGNCPILNDFLDLRNSLITGAYTQVSGTDVPLSTNFSNTNISTADMDATLIAYEACTKDNGTFQANGMTRTTASDTAVTELTGRGWTISGLTVV